MVRNARTSGHSRQLRGGEGRRGVDRERGEGEGGVQH